jgi:aarF domain-containing kinase
LCDTLATLQSGAPEHSFSFTRAQIKKELGATIDEVFDDFSKKPIASGSIAQVYKATLNGQTVAVKVRHPNVEEQIEIDFIIMKVIARFIESLPGLTWLHLSDSMAQFSSTISGQVHLDIEGRHLFLFNKHFKDWVTVGFPKPIILTNSVLVETYEIGEPVDKFMDHSSCNPQDKRVTTLRELDAALHQCDLAHFVVTTGEDIYLKMLLQDNLMHADLHPGNILIERSRPLTSPNADPTDVESEDVTELKIVLVDAGMVSNLLGFSFSMMMIFYYFPSTFIDDI